MRRASLFNTDRTHHLYHDLHLAGPRLTLHYGDPTGGRELRRVLETVDPTQAVGRPAIDLLLGTRAFDRFAGLAARSGGG